MAMIFWPNNGSGDDYWLFFVAINSLQLADFVPLLGSEIPKRHGMTQVVEAILTPDELWNHRKPTRIQRDRRAFDLSSARQILSRWKHQGRLSSGEGK
ncbi:hypothetical protein [Mesorhizobium sp. INR15]|uniref:hypothetical protein n=1 Tax=Mesorhizobium sp. INR15 TaxID=2654248 RepID=UPI001896473D|nr:hypothetical protein [Mesorhizobium sp. INR15]QPC95792.1 hypothetical protein GA829_35120 [Mesorhizobium sp. INR15]